MSNEWITSKMMELGLEGYKQYLKDNNMDIPENLPTQQEIDAEKEKNR